MLLIRPLGTNFSEFFYRSSNIFIQENGVENVVCEMASICLGLNESIGTMYNGFSRLYTFLLLIH